MLEAKKIHLNGPAENNSYIEKSTAGSRVDIVRLYLDEIGGANGKKEFSRNSELAFFQKFEKARVAFHLLKLIDKENLTVDQIEHWNGSSIVTQNPFDNIKYPQKYEQYEKEQPVRIAGFLKNYLSCPPQRQEEIKDKLRKTMQDAKPAFDQFLIANTGLVISIAKKYRWQGLDFADLIQEGNRGLLVGIHRFDWRRGLRFSTYGTWWIRQAITRALANDGTTIRIPINRKATLKNFWDNVRNLAQSLQCEPSNEDIASSMNLSKKEVEALKLDSLKITSLNLKVGEDKNKELADSLELEDEEDTEEKALSNIISQEVQNVLSILDPRGREVITRRFGLKDSEPQTLEKVGRHFNITRERVRQIESKALRQLRNHMRATGKSYF